MSPRNLMEIVAEIEREVNAIADDPSEEIHLDERADSWLRMCAALRAAEKMRNCCYADNSGGEYRPKCADCGVDYYSKHEDGCAFANFDRAVKGEP